MGLINRLSTITFTTAIIAASISACDKSADESTTEPTTPRYYAECTVTLVENVDPLSFSAEGQAATMDDAEAAAWAALCPQAGLGPDCGDNLPEGVVRNNWACVGLTNFDGTGITLAEGAGYTCTIGLSDERNVRTTEMHAEMEGTDEETADPDATVCRQAIIDACSHLGSEDGCTEGEYPEFRISGRSSSRTRL